MNTDKNQHILTSPSEAFLSALSALIRGVVLLLICVMRVNLRLVMSETSNDSPRRTNFV
jgi:hypothetical protein